jgi:hypothetical protein
VRVLKRGVCGQRGRRLLAAVSGALVLSLCPAAQAQVAARRAPRLVPFKSGSKVRLIYGKRSVVLNLEDAAAVLPGDPPHRYKTLLTARQGNTLYLLASVCSRSPVSDPNAPCGGDRPCSLLWIKADESLKEREIKGRIYASCSYNYYPVGRPRLAGSRLTVIYREGVDYGDEFELTYDNSRPEKGITLQRLGSFDDRRKRI